MSGKAKPPRPLTSHPSMDGVMVVPLTQGKVALVSSDDADAVGRFAWYARNVNGFWVAYSLLAGDPLHRFVGDAMGLSLAADVDHRNGDGLDCRRNNLRDATKHQNAQNRHIRRDSLTGVKGVTFMRDGRRLPWAARCAAGGVRAARYFATKSEAEAAAIAMRTAAHGEFANHGQHQGLPPPLPPQVGMAA